MLEWIRLNREENIDGPIKGGPGEAWWDGGRPKLRSISEVGEGKKSTKTQTQSEGRVKHPKTDVMISGLEKQNTPYIPVPKHGIAPFSSVFSFAALLSLSLCLRHSLHASRLPAHKPPEAKLSESSSPLSTYTREDRTTMIHCYSGPEGWGGRGATVKEDTLEYFVAAVVVYSHK